MQPNLRIRRERVGQPSRPNQRLWNCAATRTDAAGDTSRTRQGRAGWASKPAQIIKISRFARAVGHFAALRRGCAHYSGSMRHGFSDASRGSSPPLGPQLCAGENAGVLRRGRRSKGGSPGGGARDAWLVLRASRRKESKWRPIRRQKRAAKPARTREASIDGAQ